MNALPAIALLGALLGAASSADFGPWDLPDAPAVRASPTFRTRAILPPRRETIRGIQTTPFWVSFKFYQQVISPIDGPRCQHRPTCSMYAIQAMRKHSILGAFLTLDRLWRTGDSSSIRHMPIVLGPEGQIYYRDPLEENDFWLR